MTLRLRTIVSAAAAVVTMTLAAAGCGSTKDDTASFKQDYPAQSAKLKAIGQDLGTSMRGAGSMGNAQVATTFHGLAKRTHDAADGLKALSPPDNAKADLTKLEVAVEKVAGDLDTIASAAKTPDTAAVKKAAQALIIDSTPVKAARTSVKE